MSAYLGTVSAAALSDFCTEVFSRAGVTREHAEIVSEHLVTANLRGVDSHGALVRLHHYLSAVQQGQINCAPNMKWLRDTPSAGLVDGDNGFGQVVALRATESAIAKARSVGIGIVGARNLSHVGMLARYTMKVTEDGFIGMAATSSSPIVVPWGGAKPVLGANPFSIGFPVERESPIILDISTSMVAGGKVAVYAAKGERMPEGWALDKNGKPTTDPRAFLEDGMLLPFGGHKGYGLALSVEVFAGLLTASPFSVHIKSGWATQGGFVVQVIDVNAFRPYEEYKRDMLSFAHLLTSCPPATGFKEVLLPGEIERREYRRRLKEGVPVYQENWRSFERISKELGIPLPVLAR